jgi:hypothetical protein
MLLPPGVIESGLWQDDQPQVTLLLACKTMQVQPQT